MRVCPVRGRDGAKDGPLHSKRPLRNPLDREAALIQTNKGFHGVYTATKPFINTGHPMSFHIWLPRFGRHRAFLPNPSVVRRKFWPVRVVAGQTGDRHEVSQKRRNSSQSPLCGLRVVAGQTGDRHEVSQKRRNFEPVPALRTAGRGRANRGQARSFAKAAKFEPVPALRTAGRGRANRGQVRSFAKAAKLGPVPALRTVPRP
jgi:hypothetical protein